MRAVGGVGEASRRMRWEQHSDTLQIAAATLQELRRPGLLQNWKPLHPFFDFLSFQVDGAPFKEAWKSVPRICSCVRSPTKLE